MKRKKKKVTLNVYRKENLKIFESSSFIYDVCEYVLSNNCFRIAETKQKVCKTPITELEKWSSDKKIFVEQVLIAAPKTWLIKNGFSVETNI